MTDLIDTPLGTLFDHEPQTLAAIIRPTDPHQTTVFDMIAEAEAEPEPEFDAALVFDMIWNGTLQGFSEAKVRASLAENEQLLIDLNAKRITPTRIIGAGHRSPLTTAREYLAGRIAQDKRDLATRGRTNAVNVDNVAWHAPAGHPRKVHRIRYRSEKYSHLWQAYCAADGCGWSECGYTFAHAATGRQAEEHIAQVPA